LIVDDEVDFLEIMKTKLGAAGFDVATAKNAAEAVAQSGKLMPDLILMDIKMPGVSGADAALTIKQNPETKNLRIAFLTNLRDPWPAVADHKKFSEELGMEDFLEKTEDLNVVVNEVKEILSRK